MSTPMTSEQDSHFLELLSFLQSIEELGCLAISTDEFFYQLDRQQLAQLVLSKNETFTELLACALRKRGFLVLWTYCQESGTKSIVPQEVSIIELARGEWQPLTGGQSESVFKTQIDKAGVFTNGEQINYTGW